jgi:hypothetical protein
MRLCLPHIASRAKARARPVWSRGRRTVERDRSPPQILQRAPSAPFAVWQEHLAGLLALDQTAIEVQARRRWLEVMVLEKLATERQTFTGSWHVPWMPSYFAGSVGGAPPSVLKRRIEKRGRG